LIWLAPAAPHGRELPELGLEVDPAGLRLDVVLVQLGDRGGDGGDAPLGHEQVLTLVAPEQLVLGLLHVRLGLGQPLVHPDVGPLRGLDLALEAVVHVDVGQRVGPQGGVLGVTVGHPDLDHVGLGDRLHHEVPEEGAGGVPRLLELGPVGQLEPLHHPLRDGPRAQHLELGVEELAVPDGVAGADQRVGDGERGRVGRHDLQQGPGLVARGLQLAAEDAEGEPPDRGRREQDPPAPEQVEVVADVEVPLVPAPGGSGLEAETGGGLRGHRSFAFTTT
jgi:hypothetical protein